MYFKLSIFFTSAEALNGSQQQIQKGRKQQTMSTDGTILNYIVKLLHLLILILIMKYTCTMKNDNINIIQI